MERHNWNFILQAKGNDWSQKYFDDGVDKPMLIYENKYFKELNDAFAALMNWDLSELDPTAIYRDDFGGRHFNVIQIVDAYSNEVLFDIAKITIDDAVSKKIPAGIYISFVMEPVSFENEVGIKIPREYFIPDTYLFCLAKYTYDTSLTLTPLNMPDGINSLSNAESWQYTHQVQEYFHGIPPSDYHTRIFNHTYHYESIYEAFRDLIRTKPDRLDAFLAMSNNFHENYIQSAGIFTRDNKELISLACVRDENFPERVYDPGIHLHFNSSIRDFETLIGIELIPHMCYELEERYQLIYNYARDYESFVPTQGLNNLLKQTDRKQTPDLQNKQQSYTLEMDWVPLDHRYSGKELPKDYNQSHSHKTLDDAIKSLLEIDNILFDISNARRSNASFYMSQAAVFDSTDGKEIISKFMANSNNPYLPSGIYIRLNKEKVTIDILQTVQKYIPSLSKPDSMNFLVCKMDEDMHTITRHRKITARNTNGPRL